MLVGVVLVTIILAVLIQHLLVGLVVLVVVEEEMIMEIGHQGEQGQQVHQDKDMMVQLDMVNLVVVAAVVLEVQVDLIKLAVLAFNFLQHLEIQYQL
jgi:hypothetical protein